MLYNLYHGVHPEQQGFELFLQRHISSRQVAYADWDAIKKRTFGDTLLSWLFSTQNCSLFPLIAAAAAIEAHSKTKF